jgi:hypothetical protein
MMRDSNAVVRTNTHLQCVVVNCRDIACCPVYPIIVVTIGGYRAAEIRNESQADLPSRSDIDTRQAAFKAV